jgi:hypothetical protein
VLIAQYRRIHTLEKLSVGGIVFSVKSMFFSDMRVVFAHRGLRGQWQPVGAAWGERSRQDHAGQAHARSAALPLANRQFPEPTSW